MAGCVAESATDMDRLQHPVERTRPTPFSTSARHAVHVQLGAVGITLETGLRALRRQYQALYNSCFVERPSEDALHVRVRRMPISMTHRRRYEVSANGHTQFTPTHFNSVLPHVEWAVSWELPRALPQFLQLHASVMEVQGAGVIFPGAAGVGKSTLTVGLIARGWRYLCDEFALLHSGSLDLHPYPRAICIKEPSFPVLRELGVPILREFCFSKGSKGAVTLLSPRSLRADAVAGVCPPRFVIFPQYTPGVEPSITPISRGEAAFALHEVCFNLLHCNRLAVDILAEAIRGANCFRLTAGNIHKTCDLLQSVIERGESPCV